ncbi:MAG: hypothetical protein ABIH76_05355 [Candidatus Bathyarchaeota archaeon]
MPVSKSISPIRVKSQPARLSQHLHAARRSTERHLAAGLSSARGLMSTPFVAGSSLVDGVRGLRSSASASIDRTLVMLKDATPDVAALSEKLFPGSGKGMANLIAATRNQRLYSPLMSQRGSSSVSFQLTLAALTIGSVVAFTTLNTASFGLVAVATGATLLGAKLVTSPTFRDKTRRAAFPLAAVAVSMGTRLYLSSHDGGFGWGWSFLGGYAALTGMLVARGAFESLVVEGPRIRALESSLEMQKRVAQGYTRMLGQLDAVVQGREQLPRATARIEREASSVVSFTSTAARRMRWRGKYSRAEADAHVGSWRQMFEETMRDVRSLLAENRLDEAHELLVQSLSRRNPATARLEGAAYYPEFHKPDQVFVGVAKAVRILGYEAMVPLALCLTAKGHDLVTFVSFSLMMIFQSYYLLGGNIFSFKSEAGEYAETQRIPLLDVDPANRPQMAVLFYTRLGTYRQGKIPPFLTAHVDNFHVHGSNYRVICNNNADDLGYFDSIGGVKQSQQFSARTRFLLDNVFEGREVEPHLRHLSRDDRLFLALHLSRREYNTSARRIADTVCNEIWHDQVSDGKVKGFRTDFGVVGADKACSAALQALVGESGLRLRFGRLSRVRRQIPRLVVDNNRLNLETIWDNEAVGRFCEALMIECGLTTQERDQIVLAIETHRERFVFSALHGMARARKFDEAHAYLVARRMTERLSAVPDISSMAELGDRLFFGIIGTGEQSELSSLLSKRFGISDVGSDALIADALVSNAELRARAIAEQYEIPDRLYSRIWTFSWLGRAHEHRTQTKCEEGNIVRIWRDIEQNGPRSMAGRTDMQRVVEAAAARAEQSPGDWVRRLVGRGNSSIARLIGRRVYNAFEYRGYFEDLSGRMSGRGQSERFILAHRLGERVATLLAESRPVGSDLFEERRSGVTICRDGRAAENWEEWVEGDGANYGMRREVEALVVNYIQTEYPRHAREAGIIAAEVWAVASQELRENQQEVDRIAVGLAHWLAWETKGFRTLSENLADTGTYHWLLSALQPVEQRRENARDAIAQSIFGTTELEAEQRETVTSVVREATRATAGAIGGRRQQGYILPYSELADLVPRFLLAETPIRVKATGRTAEVSPRRGSPLVRPQNRDQFIAAVGALIRAEEEVSVIREQLRESVEAQGEPSRRASGEHGRPRDEEPALVSRVSAYNLADVLMGRATAMVRGQHAGASLEEFVDETTPNIILTTLRYELTTPGTGGIGNRNNQGNALMVELEEIVREFWQANRDGEITEAR